MDAGFSPESFWEMSFREYRAAMRGAANRLVREHNDRAWLAWHVEALARTKKLPRLQEMQHNEKPRRRAQSAAEMEAIVRAWLAGGRRR